MCVLESLFVEFASMHGCHPKDRIDNRFWASTERSGWVLRNAFIRKTLRTVVHYSYRVPDKDCTTRARNGCVRYSTRTLKQWNDLSGLAVLTTKCTCRQLPFLKPFINAKTSYQPKKDFQKHNGPMTAAGRKRNTKTQGWSERLVQQWMPAKPIDCCLSSSTDVLL